MTKESLIQNYKIMANKMLESGQFKQAIEVFEKIIFEDSTDLDAFLGIGSAFEAINNLDAAISFYKRATDLKPKTSIPFHNIGRIYILLNENTLAQEYLKKAIEITPSSESAWCDLGSSQMLNRDFIAAEISLKNSINLNPNFTLAYHNLGECSQQQRNYDQAIGLFNKALGINPNLEGTVASLAETYVDMLQSEKAINILNQFINTNPSSVICNQSLALILLKGKEFKKGFKAYDWRLAPSAKNVKSRPFTQELWKGNKEIEKKLLIWLEQGIGDEILSLNLIKYFQKLVNNCMIECEPRLESLLKRSFPSIEVFPRTNPPKLKTKNADLVCPIWSGAKYFNLENESFKTSKPLLKSNKQLTNGFRKKYSSLAKGKKIVGISWSSGGNFSNLKTPPLNAWQPLLSMQNIFFISVQYSPLKQDINQLSKFANENLYLDKTFDSLSEIDTAASQISSLDAIITVSNTIAHLSGALGKPVGTIVPYGRGSFWYWFKDTEDSIWYPSMRLFRQNNPGDWDSTIDKTIKWITKTI
jgi:tetratricopeptide (TPR) repeat protein